MWFQVIVIPTVTIIFSRHGYTLSCFYQSLPAKVSPCIEKGVLKLLVNLLSWYRETLNRTMIQENIGLLYC